MTKNKWQYLNEKECTMLIEPATRDILKKRFLNISEDSQEDTCVGVSF